MPDSAPQDTEQKPVPHSIEAEQALLGALLLNNEILPSLNVEAEHFFDPVHARIFEHCAKIIRMGRRADPVLLGSVMVADEGLKELGGARYFANMAGTAISIIAAPLYAEQIRDLAARRDVLWALEDAERAVAEMDDLQEVLGALDQKLHTVEATAPSSWTITQAGMRAMERINDAIRNELPGMDLQLPGLSERCGRALPGDMILIGGRPSMGKSAVTAEIARLAAINGYAVPYWCGEMAPEDNAERMIAATATERGTRIPYHESRQGKINEMEFKALLEAGREIEKAPITFIEPGLRDIDRVAFELRKHAKRFQDQGREVLLVVDYLQQLRAGGRSRYEQITEISQALKSLAMEVRAPIIVAAQLNREADNRDGNRPMLSDLRESGQLEQDANMVMLCFRQEYYLERAAQAEADQETRSKLIAARESVRGQMELIIPKSRSSGLSTVYLNFDAAVNHFTAAKSLNEQPYDQEAFAV